MKIIKVILMLTIVISMVGCKEEVVEEVKYEKVEYENVEDIVAMIDNNEMLYYTEINNIVYTLVEDDLVDEYYEIIYYDTIDDVEDLYTQKWVVYYLAETGQYCSGTNGLLFTCHVDSSGIQISQSHLYQYIPTPIIVNVNDYTVDEFGRLSYSILKVYEMEESQVVLDAIYHANNLFIYEEGTTEYNNSVDWLINTARGYDHIFAFHDDWIDGFIGTLELIGVVELLGEMQGLTFTEIAENYYKYREVLYELHRQIQYM